MWVVGLSALVLLFTVLACYYPQGWIGVVIFASCATLPNAIPTQFWFGMTIYVHEIALLLYAIWVLHSKPPNRLTDWCSAAIIAITTVFAGYGYVNDHPVGVIIVESRTLITLALAMFIAGRIAATPLGLVALKAVKFTLWVSFLMVVLGAAGRVPLNAREEDAALTLDGRTDTSSMVRILGETTHLATAVMAVCVCLWIIKAYPFTQILGYFVPAFGITVLGFSRNGLVLIAVAMIALPLFERSLRVLVRSVLAIVVAVAAFVAVGKVTGIFAHHIPGADYLHRLHTAYADRVIEGLKSSTRQRDSSALYRQIELRWLKEAVPGHEVFGHGLGYQYKPASGSGFEATAGTYYAHHFYWWAVVKTGWLGLVGYVAAMIAPVLSGLWAGRGIPIRSAAGATVIGFLAISTVAPLPESTHGAPVLGALIAVAALTRPARSPATPAARSMPIPSRL